MNGIEGWDEIEAWWRYASDGEKGAVFAALFLFGIVTALIANGKGRNPIGWFVFGAILPLIGMIVALAVPSLRAKPAAAAAPPQTVYVQQPVYAPPPAAPAERPASITDEIHEAKALLDAGTITQAEFETIKARILRR